MRISLIGMSNVGKTYWSKKLEKIGFRRLSCDDIIEEKLKDELSKCGYSGISDVARWMGQPYERKYPRTSKRYLGFETESLNEIIQKLRNNYSKDNIVVDTTGSAIYIDSGIINCLSTLTTIVYLDTPKLVRQEMYEAYLQNPRPVIWGNIFRKFDGESDLEALAKCYPRLLEYRTKIYKKYAHITLDYFLLRKGNLNAGKFLQLVQAKI